MNEWIKPQRYWGRLFDLLGSCDVIGHVTLDSHCMVHYRWSFEDINLSSMIVEIFCIKRYCAVKANDIFVKLYAHIWQIERIQVIQKCSKNGKRLQTEDYKCAERFCCCWQLVMCDINVSLVSKMKLIIFCSLTRSFGHPLEDWLSEMDTGRVDPRVGSGRVGSRVRVKADLAGRVGSGQHFWNALFFVKKVSMHVAKQNVDFYSASTS